jgi:hypothetical protein
VARRTLLGVFAKDNIPRLPSNPKKYPISFVINSERLHEPGEHWVAVYYKSPNNGEYFDSYGGSPPALGFTKARLPGIRRWNRIKLQSMHSGVCGHYCVLFVVSRARGAVNCNDVFSRRRGFHWSTPERNDAVVERLVHTIS